MRCVNNRTYAVEGFGEAGCPHPEGTRRLPKVFCFWHTTAAGYPLGVAVVCQKKGSWRAGYPLGAPPNLPASELSLVDSGKHPARSEEHTSELQSLRHLVCRLL